jgi:hypothetical protein
MNAQRKRAPDQHVDRGADGPAMDARPWVMATIEDDTAAGDGVQRFTRSEVKRVRDSVIDFYSDRGILSGAMRDAAIDLAKLYEAGRNAPTGYRTGCEYGGGEMSDERAAAWAAYCRALDRLPLRCVSACEDVARDKFPTALNAVANMQEGFRFLATVWRMTDKA